MAGDPAERYTITKTLYEEGEEYIFSEIARYAAGYQRLDIENQMHLEKEDYLLSEIPHMASNKSSIDPEIKRFEGELQGTPWTESFVVEKEGSGEPRRECFNIGKNERGGEQQGTPWKESFLNIEKEERGDPCRECFTVKKRRVGELQGTPWKESFNFGNDSSLSANDKTEAEDSFTRLMEEKTASEYQSEGYNLKLIAEYREKYDELKRCYNADEVFYQTQVNELSGENKELEERLISLIEQNLSIRRCADVSIERLIREKDALQANLNFLNKDLVHRKEKAGRILSEVAQLMRRNEDLVEELVMVKEKNSMKIDKCYATAVVFLYFALFSIVTGTAFISAFMGIIYTVAFIVLVVSWGFILVTRSYPRVLASISSK